jgi:hypothetical protein
MDTSVSDFYVRAHVAGFIVPSKRIRKRAFSRLKIAIKYREAVST